MFGWRGTVRCTIAKNQTKGTQRSKMQACANVFCLWFKCFRTHTHYININIDIYIYIIHIYIYIILYKYNMYILIIYVIFSLVAMPITVSEKWPTHCKRMSIIGIATGQLQCQSLHEKEKNHALQMHERHCNPTPNTWNMWMLHFTNFGFRLIWMCSVCTFGLFR